MHETQEAQGSDDRKSAAEVLGHQAESFCREDGNAFRISLGESHSSNDTAVSLGRNSLAAGHCLARSHKEPLATHNQVLVFWLAKPPPP